MKKKEPSKPCPHCGYHECPQCGKPIIPEKPHVYPWPYHPWMITNITTSTSSHPYTYFTFI